MDTNVAVILIARNEEKVLPRLLKSLVGIKDIVILDTGSTDQTVEVAKKLLYIWAKKAIAWGFVITVCVILVITFF